MVVKYNTYEEFLALLTRRESDMGVKRPQEYYKKQWLKVLYEKAQKILNKSELAMYRSKQVTVKHGQDVFEDFQIFRSG